MNPIATMALLNLLSSFLSPRQAIIIQGADGVIIAHIYANEVIIDASCTSFGNPAYAYPHNIAHARLWYDCAERRNLQVG